ncbi:hypothetical protein GCM10027402_30990 [Arthrobacter monumenti]
MISGWDTAAVSGRLDFPVKGCNSTASGTTAPDRLLDIEEPNILGILLDEVSPEFDVFAHQD